MDSLATYVAVAYKGLLLSINNIIISLYAGSVMASFYYASSPICGNWFQTNQPEHISDDRAGDKVTCLCVLPMENNILDFSGKFDQYLSLCCHAVKPKIQTGPRYWFL